VFIAMCGEFCNGFFGDPAGHWLFDAEQQDPAPGDMPSAPNLGLAKVNDRLREKNPLLKEERDIQKGATVFFAELSK